MHTTLEELQAHINRMPANQYMNLEILGIDEGIGHVRMPYNSAFINSWGATHGGALMTLADIAFFVALVTLNGLGVSGRISTAEVKTNFLKPNKDSDLYAKARVIKNGKKIVFGDVTTINGRDETIAHSTVTYFRTQVTFP